MKRLKVALLAAASGGTLLASECDVADGVLQTILLSFRIVDVWV